MEIRFDRTNLADHQPPAIDVFLSPEHQYRQPTASADGVSFPAVPRVKPLIVAATATIIFLGTASPRSEAIDVRKFHGFKIVLPSASQAKATTTAERYARLKQEIVAAGIPLLNDAELREEIRSREGVKVVSNTLEMALANELASVRQVRDVLVESVRDSFLVWITVDDPERAVRDLIFQKQMDLMDAFPEINFDFNLIPTMGRSIKEIATDARIVYSRPQ